MSKLLLLILVSSFSINLISAKHVKGHARKKGTYVQPYSRSNPNKSKADNYSTKGSVNPYTNVKGSK